MQRPTSASPLPSDCDAHQPCAVIWSRLGERHGLKAMEASCNDRKLNVELVLVPI